MLQRGTGSLIVTLGNYEPLQVVRNSLRLAKVFKSLVILHNANQLVLNKYTTKPSSTVAGGKGGRKG